MSASAKIEISYYCSDSQLFQFSALAT